MRNRLSETARSSPRVGVYSEDVPAIALFAGANRNFLFRLYGFKVRTTLIGDGSMEQTKSLVIESGK